MLTALHSLLLGLLPWGVGVGMLYALLYQPKRWHPGHHLMVMGLGSYIGYMLLALTMYQLQARNLPVFSSWLIAWGIAGVLICWVVGELGRHRCKLTPKESAVPTWEFKPAEPKWLLFLIGSWLIVQFGFVAYEIALRPTVSWDTLWYWTTRVVGFIQWQESNPSLDSTSLQSLRHPTTIHLLNAWAAYSGHVSGSRMFLYAPWMALYGGIIIGAVGIAWVVTRKLILGLIIANLIASSSVVAAQSALAGYADVWLAAGLFFSAVTLIMAHVCWKPVAWVTWVFIIGTLTFLKAAGVSYTALSLVVVLMAWGVSQSRLRWAAAAILVATAALGYSYMSGFDLSISGYRLAFDTEVNHIIVGHYVGIVNLDELQLALHNTWHAFVSNTSYLMAILIPAAALILVAIYPRYWRCFDSAYALLLGLGLLLYGLAGQVFSDYFLTYSSPDKDTGLTRFSQGWFLVSAIALTYLLQSYLNGRDSEHISN